MLTIVFDRDVAVITYQDGVEVGQKGESFPDLGNLDSGSPWRIAQDGTGNYPQFFQGK